MLFPEDSFDDACRQIVNFLTFLAFALWFVLVALYIQVWCRVQIGGLKARGWLMLAWYRLQRIGSHVYWKHIHVWLVVSGFQRELTWAEVGQRRLQAIARTGVDIPRPPALEKGLQQELGLDV